MENINKNSFPQVMPNHPHRSLYILISVLVFVLVSAIIIYNQISSINNNFDSNQSSSLSKDQKARELNSKLIEISKEMKESGAGQTTLSNSQLDSIADSYNKRKTK